MSSSDETRRFGTIFMGPTSNRETTLDKLFDADQREQWTQRTEEQYMDRVRAKATEKVRGLLQQAQERVVHMHAEAEKVAAHSQAACEAMQATARQTLEEARELRQQATVLRDAAHKEGFEAGRQEALTQLNQAREALGETTAIVLLGIHQQCGAIFEAWRKDMVALFHEAVHKATDYVVDTEKAAVLERLLSQSMRAMLDKRNFVVHVNPTDAALLTDMLAEAHRSRPESSNWQLQSDPNLEPGSLIVESDSGLVDNSRAARRAVLDEVLEHLTLPLGDADQQAYSRMASKITHEMAKHGVQLAQEGETYAEEGEPEGDQAPPSPAVPPAEEVPAENFAEAQPAPSAMESPDQFAEAVLEAASQNMEQNPEAAEINPEPLVPEAVEAEPGTAEAAEEVFEAPQPEAPADLDPFEAAMNTMAAENPAMEAPPAEPQPVPSDDPFEMAMQAMQNPPDPQPEPTESTDPLADELLAELGFGPEPAQKAQE